MLAGPSGGNGSTERVESVAQSVTSNHTIQLKLTTDNPDKPISRKITYDALPAWRHLCSKIEKLFGINFDAIQVIYPLENEIIVKGDHDLHAVLGSAPIAEHIFKFIVRNMHSPKTGSKIIGRPTHNRLPTPKKFHMDMLRALDTDIPPLNEPPPNIMNHKPKKYRLFPLNGVYNEDYLRKRADRYNSVPLGVPLETPRITSNIDWPKEIPERITGPKSQLPGPSAITGPKPTNEVRQRPVQTQTQPVRSIPAPALEPVQGLALDLGPPASGFIQPASTLEEPSEVHVTFNNNNNTPRPSSSILHAFPIPPPRIIPPPPSQSSIPELVPASMFPIIRVDNTETNSLGFGLNLPLGMMHPNSTMLLSPQPTKQRHSGGSDRPTSNTRDPQDSLVKPRLSPPPGFIPTGRNPPQPRPSPMGRIIDDTSDFTNPIMLLSPLLLPGEEQASQNNNRADNNRLRRRPGEIVVIEDTSASSPNSVGGGGGGSAGGLESLLRNGSGGSASGSISPPLGSAAIQRYLDADSDCSSEQVQRPKARIHTPPISSSRTRSRHPDPMLKMKLKTSSRRHTKTMRPPSPEPCSESSSSSPPPSIKIFSEKKKKSPNADINSNRSGEPTASVVSTFQLSPATTTSKPKSSSAPAPPRPLDPIPSSSTSTKQHINSLSDHAAGPMQSIASSETLPIPSKTTPYDPKIEIGDVIRVQVKDLIREVIEELKNEMQRTMTEMFRVHCNEIREQLTQADRQSTERSRGDSQERPTYAASTTHPHPHHPHPPPPPSSHFPPAVPSGSIPQSHPSLSVPPPISYHPYMSLPTSTLIFPPHHPYCGDYTLPTPTFSIPYRSYMIPSVTGLPSYHPGACCHIHHAMKPGDIPVESSYYHHAPPPPPPLAHHVPPPPLSSGPQHPYFYGRGRWFTPDTQTPGMGAGVAVGAAPAYSGNNNESSSLPQQPVDVDRMRNEYSEGLARLRNIEERFSALLDGPENGKPCAEKREVSTLTSVQTNSEQSRKESANVAASLDGGSHQRSAWESLMSYVSKPGFGLAWPRVD